MTYDETEHGRSGPTDGQRADSGIDDGDVSALEAELRRRREPYAKATVVRRKAPASANVGDSAIVTADGELHGWIGGAACAQSIVSGQGREAIESETPRLIGIAPDPETVDRPGLEAFPMTCHSDGVLELFVEPVTPATELVIVGHSPVAGSLARLASELTLDITVVSSDEDRPSDLPDDIEVVDELDPASVADSLGPDPLVVVASMGEYDARGIAIGLLADAPYVGLIASDERARTETELAAGIADVDVETVEAAVTAPAGVDIAARTPAEIAASLLAELVDMRNATSGLDTQAAGVEESTNGGDTTVSEADATDGDGHEREDGSVVDPVCGMDVDPASSAATVEHGGETYHFCCHGCADSFENDPESYLESPGGHA